MKHLVTLVQKDFLADAVAVLCRPTEPHHLSASTESGCLGYSGDQAKAVYHIFSNAGLERCRHGNSIHVCGFDASWSV